MVVHHHWTKLHFNIRTLSFPEVLFHEFHNCTFGVLEGLTEPREGCIHVCGLLQLQHWWKPEDLSVVPSTHLMSGTLTRICSPPLGRQAQDVPAACWSDHLAWGAVQNPIPKRSRMESSWVRHLTLTCVFVHAHTLTHTPVQVRTHTYTQMCTQVPFFQGVVIISSLTHIKTYNIWT